MTHALIVLISGNGSNLQAILDACHPSGALPTCKVVLVVSNRSEAYGLERAKKANVPTLIRPWKRSSNISREAYDLSLGQELTPYNPDLIVLAGWLHILSPVFIDQFPERVINLHPALPNAYDGMHAIERAYSDAQKGLSTFTGCMVHTVTPILDKGRIWATRTLPIDTDQPLSVLEENMHQTEHVAIIEGINNILDFLFPGRSRSPG
jgi:formyltetrahydrofolate-dependent phosphoribosylglycinamide formyltransferase